MLTHRLTIASEFDWSFCLI